MPTWRLTVLSSATAALFTAAVSCAALIATVGPAQAQSQGRIPQVNELSVGWRGGYALPPGSDEISTAHAVLKQRLADIAEPLAAELPDVENLAWLWRGFQINRAGFIPLDPEASDPEPGDLEDVAWCDGEQRQVYRFRYTDRWQLVDNLIFDVLECTPLAQVGRQINEDLHLSGS